MNISDMSEARLRKHVEGKLFRKIDPDVPLLKKRCAREVKIGAFKLDLLAQNEEGGLTIVEYKINAQKATLAQLLLYPRAVRVVLGEKCPRLRMVLVTTYLDEGVVKLANRIRFAKVIEVPCEVIFRVLTRDLKRLVAPDDLPPAEKGQLQYWDQAKTSGGRELKWDKGIVVSGQRWTTAST